VDQETAEHLSDAIDQAQATPKPRGTIGYFVDPLGVRVFGLEGVNRHREPILSDLTVPTGELPTDVREAVELIRNWANVELAVEREDLLRALS
jgi:hypothetical protein